MKVIKPTRLSLLCRSYENDGKYYFVATVALFFPFDDPKRLLEEQAMWVLTAEELGQFTPLDGFMGHDVINGDLSDYRFKDPHPVIVGLRSKGTSFHSDSTFIQNAKG